MGNLEEHTEAVEGLDTCEFTQFPLLGSESKTFLVDELSGRKLKGSQKRQQNLFSGCSGMLENDSPLSWFTSLMGKRDDHIMHYIHW